MYVKMCVGKIVRLVLAKRCPSPSETKYYVYASSYGNNFQLIKPSLKSEHWIT